MFKKENIDILKSGADVICHQVNCLGVMGTGLAKQIREAYPRVFEDYKTFVEAHKDRRALLGKVLYCTTQKGQVIANMFGQLRYGYNGCHTNYKALEACLKSVAEFANGKTIAIPYKLGCGAGGGDWAIVSRIIFNVFENYEGIVMICLLQK